MTQVVLNQILNQLEMLELQELEQLIQAIHQRLTKQKEANDRAAVHEALLASGLVKRIRKPAGQPVEPQLLEIEEEPVSELKRLSENVGKTNLRSRHEYLG